MGAGRLTHAADVLLDLPGGPSDITTGQKVDYDQETVELYRGDRDPREARAVHLGPGKARRDRRADHAAAVLRLPEDERVTPIADEWMLGPAVLAAPMLSSGASAPSHLPTGNWIDVNHGTVIRGPKTLKGYPAPLGVTPAFVNLKAKGADKAIRALKRDDAPAAAVLITPDAPATDAGKPFQVTTDVTNWSTGTLTSVKAALGLPDGWTAKATGPTTASSLKNGATLTTTWTVTPATDARWGSHDLTGTATYNGSNGSQKVSDTVQAQVKAAPSSVQAPYLTTDTTSEDPQYAQAGDQFAIWAGGQDLSGWKDEKGVIYRADAAGEKSTVQAQLVSQHSTSPVGKAASPSPTT